MSIVSKSNQALYSSEDYVNALQSVNHVEKAIALTEKGRSVVRFSSYIEEYVKLMKRVISTNDSGHDINPNMRKAHYKLTKQIQGLEKRVAAACVRTQILPPSANLIQMLKVDEIHSAKPPRRLSSNWTWTDIAKYSALAGVAVLGYSQLLAAIKETPKIIVKAIPVAQNVIPEAGNAILDIYAGGKATATILGRVINAARLVVNQTGIPALPTEDPTSLGTSTLLNLAVKQALWSCLIKPFAKPILPIPVVLGINTVILASTACNAIVPNCSKTVIDDIHSLSEKAAEHPEIAAPALFTALFTGVHYKDHILASFGSAAGFALPVFAGTISVPAAILTLESVSPEFRNLTAQYPDTVVNSIKAGAVGSSAVPVLLNGWMQAKANLLLAPVGATRAAVKAGIKARDTSLFKQRYKVSMISGLLTALLHPIFEGIKHSCSAQDGYCKQHPYITAAASIAGITVGTFTAIGVGAAAGLVSGAVAAGAVLGMGTLGNTLR